MSYSMCFIDIVELKIYELLLKCIITILWDLAYYQMRLGVETWPKVFLSKAPSLITICHHRLPYSLDLYISPLLMNADEVQLGQCKGVILDYM